MTEPLPPAALRVREAAAALRLPVEIRVHEASTRTAEEAAAACGCELGQIVKSLVFAGRASGEPVLILLSGDDRVDESLAAMAAGQALVRPDGRQVRAWTGFAIGGIPPFGHATRLPTYLDERLLRFERVWAAAGTPNAVFATDPAELGRAISAKIVRIAARP